MKKNFLLVLCVLAILFGCKQNVSQKNQVQQQPEKKKENTEKNTVSILFDSKSLSCNKGVKTGDDVENGVELTFSFIGKIEKGKKLKAFKVGEDEIVAGNKKKFKFNVDIKKAEKEKDGRLVLKIGVNFEDIKEPTPPTPNPNPNPTPNPNPNPSPDPNQPDPTPSPDEPDPTPDKSKLTIKFGDDIAKCEWVGILSNSLLNSGGKVPFGTILRFTAKLEGGERIEKWFINGKEQEKKKGATFEYTAKKEDGDEKSSITVRCEKLQVQKLKLKYDPLLMECVDYGNGSPLPPKASIYPEQKLKFTATIKPGFNFVNWTINGDDKADERREVFVYTVSENDGRGEDKEIAIGYKCSENASYKLIFNERQMQCKVWKTGEKLKSGDKVYDDVYIQFTSILEGDDELEQWVVKGKDKGFASRLSYRVNKEDVDDSAGEQVIHVTIRLKKKYKFEFDDNLISVKYYGDNKAIDKVKGVTVGYSLVVLAWKKEGRVIREWKINGKTLMYKNQVIKDEKIDYKVDGKDANDDVIKIELITEDAVVAKVKFDESNIKCMRGSEEVKNEADVKEGDTLDFSMKKKIRGERFEKWMLNDIEETSNEKFRYVVKKEDIQQDEVRIGYKKTTFTAFTLQFAEPIVKCTTNGEDVSTGMPCYEGEKLHFTLRAGIENSDVIKWTVKNVDQSSLWSWGNSNYLDYTVKTNDVELIAGVFTLRVACEVKEKFRIIYEDAVLKCRYYGGTFLAGAKIESNSFATPNEWIQFDAKLESGKKVKTWKVNGVAINKNYSKHYWEGTKNQTLHCRFQLSDGKVANDGVKEIVVSVEIE